MSEDNDSNKKRRLQYFASGKSEDMTDYAKRKLKQSWPAKQKSSKESSYSQEPQNQVSEN